MNPTYLATAKALIAAAPHVFFDNTFALKGGTAINLFFRDMPRLSVDLDLVLPDHTLPWAAASWWRRSTGSIRATFLT